MPVHVLWDNEAKTTIRYNYVGKWTWDELYVASDTVNTMMESVTHQVCIIHNLIDSAGLPSGFIAHGRRFTEELPANWGLSVVVGSGLFAQSLVKMFGKLYPKLGAHYRAAPDLEQARALIAKAQENHLKTED